MKVLVLHNRYNQRGGEDSCVDAETALLKQYGVEVASLIVENDDSEDLSFGAKLRTAFGGVWSSESYNQVRDACRQWNPDIAHIHNFWMKLSPAAHSACVDEGVPTIQSIHNYRMICVNALMLRDQKVCSDCSSRIPWRGIWHRCYRDSACASAAVAGMIAYHRFQHTWQDVDGFIAVSDHVRSQLVHGAIPAERIFVKPNFVPKAEGPWKRPSESDYLLFAGRLSQEKGCRELIQAWIEGGLSAHGRLLIAGEGPQKAELLDLLAVGVKDHRVELLGLQTRQQLKALMREARAVVFPSVWNEPFGLTAIEAYSYGKPVLASRRGGLTEVVIPEKTGVLFEISDADDTARALRSILLNGEEADRLGLHALERYTREYTPERNFEILMSIYDRVRERFSARRPGVPLRSAVAPGAIWTSN
jgi:glycosyltransferase involved in cell wall biosynthesis